MIEKFKHKGLRDFFFKGIEKGVQATHVKRMRLLLAKLHTARDIKDLGFPGSGLHPLKGKKKDFWSVSVNGNWRLIFRFFGGDVFDLDYVDYH